MDLPKRRDVAEELRRKEQAEVAGIVRGAELRTSSLAGWVQPVSRTRSSYGCGQRARWGDRVTRPSVEIPLTARERSERRRPARHRRASRASASGSVRSRPGTGTRGRTGDRNESDGVPLGTGAVPPDPRWLTSRSPCQRAGCLRRSPARAAVRSPKPRSFCAGGGHAGRFRRWRPDPACGHRRYRGVPGGVRP